MSSPLGSRLTDAQQALTIAWGTKSHADIDIAITKWASILRDIDEDEEKCDDILSSYASALLLRWKKRSKAEDIDKAIDTLEKSIHIQGDSPTLARYENYCNLGAAYLDRWEALEREASDLLTAAERWELAHSIATQIGQTQESARVILPNLGDVYCFAYHHKFLDISAISRAIERYSSALSVATPKASPKLRYKLGKTYATLFVETNEDASLRLGHSYLEESVTGTLPDSQREDAAIELSNIYSHEYEQRKSRDSLDSAIFWARRAVHIQDEEGDPRILRKVASLLTLLYKDFGDTTALEGAILCYEHAWDLPGSHQKKDSATFYYNYGTVLMRRSSIAYTPQQRVKADLKQAIELLRLAVDKAESEDSLMYEVQLKTAQERYNNVDRYSSVRPYRHDDGKFTMAAPIRSATVPGIVNYQLPSTSVAAKEVPNPFAPRPSLDADLDNMRPNKQTPSHDLLAEPDAQLDNSDDLFDSNPGGWLPSARRQTMQYPAMGLGERPWHSAQSDVEVWASPKVIAEPTRKHHNMYQVFPTQYINSRLPNTHPERSDSESLPSRSLSLDGVDKPVHMPTPSPRTTTTYLVPSSGVDQDFLSPIIIVFPPSRTPPVLETNPTAPPPPSPKRSVRTRFATISGAEVSGPSLVESSPQVSRDSLQHTKTAALPIVGITRHGVLPHNSRQFQSDSMGQSSTPTTPQTQSPPLNRSMPTSRSASLPTEASLADTGLDSTISSSHDPTNGSDSIRPTNLTGRIVKTDKFPVDEGGFSSIYKGAFGSTKVAIKVIRNISAVDFATLRKRLRREMDVWWKLDHPNVVPLWGYTDDMGPLPSMISPWYENGNASNYVQKEGLGLEFRLQLLREVSTGLRYLHHFSPPVVHGDLKPGNILIDNDGVARLCDFGLAHLVSDAETSFTSAGNVGTIRYAAPELRCPENDDECVRASTETDIYSLACIAYEFLYQKLPFADKGSIQTIIAAGYSHIPPARKETENPSTLGPTTPHYWELFQSCWDEIPNKRPNITSFCEHIDLAFLAFAN